MSLNHSLALPDFYNPVELGGKLESPNFDNITANEFIVDNIEVAGAINLSPTSNIIQNNNTITPIIFGYLSEILSQCFQSS